MLKVSFKQGEFKKVHTFNNKVTFVTLEGHVSLPANLQWSPLKSCKYLHKNPYVEVIFGYSDIIIEAKGMAKIAKGDTFNSVTGERIAESKAKIKIYKFMCSYIKITMEELTELLYGTFEYKGGCHTVVIPDFKGGLQDEYTKYQRFLLKEKTHLKELINKS